MISSIRSKPKTYQGCAAKLSFAGGGVRSVELIPLDLSFTADSPFAGHPRLAEREMGESIILEIAELSRPMGAEIIYDPDRNLGRLSPRN